MTQKHIFGYCQKKCITYNPKIFFTHLLTTHFSTTGLSAIDVHADWLLDRSLAAKWAKLLITYLDAAYLTH